MKGKNVILSLILISCFILFGYYYKSMYVSNSIEAINMKAMNKKYVYPLGEIVGIKATTDGVLVIGYEEENIEYIGGIEKGDNIIAINDIKIENVQDISEILEDVNEDEVKISLIRDENCIDENIKLKKSISQISRPMGGAYCFRQNGARRAKRKNRRKIYEENQTFGIDFVYGCGNGVLFRLRQTRNFGIRRFDRRKRHNKNVGNRARSF